MAIDRGLSFGDGLFETLRVINAQAPLAEWHWQRLQAGAARLAIPCEAARWEAGLSALLAQHLGQNGIAKLIFTAGVGGRGYSRPTPLQPNWYWSWHDYVPRPSRWYEQGMALALSPVQLANQPLLAGMKHLNRLPQVMARQQQPADADEVLLCDQNGQPLSLSCMNIYARFGDHIWTPEVTHAGVAGVTRRMLLEQWLSGSRWIADHQRLSFAQLAEADEMFASNVVAGILPIRTLGDWNWPVGEAGRYFQTCYQRAIT